MKLKIKQFATVKMGYSFRSGMETFKLGDVAVIQMKDLSSGNKVLCSELIKVDMGAVKDRHLAQKGDLVFRSRGKVTSAAILLEDPGKAVVAAPLITIRIINAKLVIPEYLNWFISQQEAQKFLKSRQEGTSVNMISTAQLAELPVWIPSPEKQKAIVEIAELLRWESKLLQRLAQKRKQYIRTVLMQSAKGDEHHDESD